MLQDLMAKALVLLSAIFTVVGVAVLFLQGLGILNLVKEPQVEEKTVKRLLKLMAITVTVVVFVFLASYLFNDILFKTILLQGKGTSLLQAGADMLKAFTESIPTPGK